MKAPNKLSDLLFAIFMLLYGIVAFVGIPSSNIILGILALVIGVLKFLGK